jgi:hypothetical protein
MTPSACLIKKFDAARQMIWTEVYVPYVPDSQGDFMSPAEIESTAYNFMRGQRMYNVDTEHDLSKNDTVVIESFIARKGDEDFIPGSWVVGMHVVNPKMWAKVEKGEVNALSMYGSGSREDAVIEIEIPDDGIVKGDTHDSQNHKHAFYLQFDEHGKVIKGHTDSITVGGQAHSHVIKGGTVTEPAAGHAHRYSVSDALAKIMGDQA